MRQKDKMIAGKRGREKQGKKKKALFKSALFLIFWYLSPLIFYNVTGVKIYINERTCFVEI